MYTLTRLLPWPLLVRRQLPVLALALLIAEGFYKFGSFMLEAAAFLATWYVLDAAGQLVRGWTGREPEGPRA
jgi:hypothetical protein